jgi:hypothetical protein
LRHTEIERNYAAGVGVSDGATAGAEALPPKILNITTPQVGHFPLIAFRPFFINSSTASAISFFALHFTQYPSGIRTPQNTLMRLRSPNTLRAGRNGRQLFKRKSSLLYCLSDTCILIKRLPWDNPKFSSRQTEGQTARASKATMLFRSGLPLISSGMRLCDCNALMKPTLAQLARNRKILVSSLCEVRQSSLRASRSGDFREVGKLTSEAARLNSAIAEVDLAEIFAL